MYNMWSPYMMPPPPSNVKELKQLLKLYKQMEKGEDGKGFLSSKGKKEIKKTERNIGEVFLLLTIFFPLIGVLYSYCVVWGIKQVLELLQTLPH